MVAKSAAFQAPYSLYLSKHARLPAMTVPFRWILKIVEKLLLKRCDYYAIKDRNGKGKAEPKTERINKRMAPILAYVMVMLLLIGIAVSAYFERHFSEVLAFAGTVIGAITGHYFSRTAT